MPGLQTMPMSIAAIAVAGTVGSLTDWLFMGVLFHDAYSRYPEVWREGVREGKSYAARLLLAGAGFVLSRAAA